METQQITTKSLNQLNFFDYTTGSVRVYGTSLDPWFVAKDVCDILGYKNTVQAVNKNVEKEDCSRLEIQSISTGYTSKIHPHTVLINESGLYSLLLRSRKPEAKLFKRWVTSSVLPSIRKTGKYDIKQESEQDKLTGFLNCLTLFEKVMEGAGGMDDRDRLLVKDLAKNAIMGSTGALVECKRVTQEWSISRRLNEIYGVTSKAAMKLCSAFGKVLAKSYREIYGEDPPTRQQFVNGAVRTVNCYYTEHWDDHFDELLEKYFAAFLTYEDEEEIDI